MPESIPQVAAKEYILAGSKGWWFIWVMAWVAGSVRTPSSTCKKPPFSTGGSSREKRRENWTREQRTVPGTLTTNILHGKGISA